MKEAEMQTTIGPAAQEGPKGVLAFAEGYGGRGATALPARG